MAQAQTLRPGAVVRQKGEYFKVLESQVHQGGGKAGAMVHAKFRNLATGAVSEARFNPKDEVEALAVERTKMQFLFAEGDRFTFMHPETYDQVPVARSVIGPASRFFKENDVVEVESFEGRPLCVHYQDVVELSVSTTGAGIRGQTDSTYKEAVLENGVKLLVPQFIKEGDRVRVEVETGKYLDRARDPQR